MRKFSKNGSHIIQVINNTYIYGDQFLQGIVSIHTNTENFGGIKTDEGANFLTYQTITPQTIFPETDYTIPKYSENKLPDFRNTLFWNPEVVLEGGITDIRFFASDYCNEYEIIVSGYNNEGIPCSGKKTIRITR